MDFSVQANEPLEIAIAALPLARRRSLKRYWKNKIMAPIGR